MKELNRDKASIHYEVSGKGDTTLLFIHGSYTDQSYWKSQVEQFKNNYRVVTLDLPGHGTSGRERTFWSLEGFAKDVNYVVQELELDQVILIGHSMGADVGLLAITAFPQPYIGFIAVDYFKNAATPLPGEQVSAILGQLKTDFVNTNEQYARTGLLSDRTPAEISKRVIQDYRSAYQPMGKQLMPELFGFYKMQRNLLPKLNMKLHIISVDYMPVHEEPLRHFATQGYKVLHMPGTSHFPMLENPVLLNELLQFCISDIGK
jgi:sigma-B regulation protein RsbQ